MGYLFLIIANIAGISKVAAMKGCGKECPGEYNSVRINAFRALLCTLVSVVIFYLTGARFKVEEDYIWILSGLSNALMMFVWILCAQKIGLLFVEAFAMVGAVIIPMLIAPLLYEGESVSVWQWVGVVCLLIALIILSLTPNKAKKTDTVNEAVEARNSKEKLLIVFYLALLIISNAGVSITQKLYPIRAGKEYTAYFNLMTFAVVFLCFSAVLLCGKIFKGKSLLPKDSASGKKLVIFVSLAAVMIYVYQYFATLAAGVLPSAVYYPLSRGIGMMLTVLCDMLIFKQKVTKNMIFGLCFVFAAIVLTNL